MHVIPFITCNGLKSWVVLMKKKVPAINKIGWVCLFVVVVVVVLGEVVHHCSWDEHPSGLSRCCTTVRSISVDRQSASGTRHGKDAIPGGHPGWNSRRPCLLLSNAEGNCRSSSLYGWYGTAHYYQQHCRNCLSQVHRVRVQFLFSSTSVGSGAVPSGIKMSKHRAVPKR